MNIYKLHCLALFDGRTLHAISWIPANSKAVNFAFNIAIQYCLFFFISNYDFVIRRNAARMNRISSWLRSGHIFILFTIGRYIVLMHLSQSTIFRLVVSSYAIAKLADVVAMLMFGSNAGIELLKGCFKFGFISTGQSLIGILKLWLNTRNPVPITSIQGPSLAQVVNQILL